MTIKKKMITMGGISILVFACLFVVNVKTYYKYQENMQLREDANKKLVRIEEFAEWKNAVASLIDSIAASGHVPDDIQKQFAPPSDLLKKESETLISAGDTLIAQIQNKEKKESELREKFVSRRLQINELYRQLDAEISTVLAKAEIAQVLGGDAANDSSVAAYVLKSLNQVTLIALNTLVSKKLPEKEKGRLEKNRQFITSQVKSFAEGEQIQRLFQALFVQVDSLDTFIVTSNQKMSDMEKSLSTARNAFEQAVKAGDPGQMIADARSEVEQANQELEKAARFNLIAMSLFLVVGLLAVIGVIWFIFSRVLSPIQRVSSGLNKTANHLAYAAEQVSGSSLSVAQGAASQASSSEEISSSLEEVSSMSRQNSDKANQTDAFMSDLKKTVQAANTAMNLLSESIDEIAKTTDATSGIIKSIEEVAFQTNLLSLNAAVEAARAGEGGAGFAVVAEEVRSLATKTAELVKNTSELLERIIRKVRDGSEMLANTNEKFSEIVSGSVNTATLVREIATFSGEQSNGIEQVSRGVLEIDRVAQENAGSAEEYASISGELGSQAEQMKNFIEELMRIIGKSENPSG